MAENKNGHGNSNTSKRYCCFCGRDENQVNFLIPSPKGVYICDYCVLACSDILDDAFADYSHNTESFKLEDLLAVVPDEVVMQVDMEIKAFGGIAPPPVPVTKELIADIITRAYNEN